MADPVITIHLKDLQFFAYHGLYDFEKKEGNSFLMNISLSYVQRDKIIYGIDETIDYAAVYEVVQAEMQQPRQLLETFLGELAGILKERYPNIQSVDMCLLKLSPRIKGLNGSVGVQWQRSWDNDQD